jgi:N-carbamoyl-L-amino-acid hydrolase
LTPRQTSLIKELRVNGKRLQQSLEEMAKIGATPGGGVQRLTLSDEDKQARDLFVEWLKELDLEITIDEMGSIFGKRPGKNNDLAPVMSGSHIDSQPKGGRFDGILGVMGPLEVLRTLHENNIEKAPDLPLRWWHPGYGPERSNATGSTTAPTLTANALKMS